MNHIYAIKRGSEIFRWFTSPLARDPSQVSGINSFLRLQTRTFANNEQAVHSGLHIEKFLYRLETNAKHKPSGLMIYNLTSLAYQIASGKFLVCVIPPQKIGRITKISNLKQNLLNEHQTLQNLDSKVKAPRAIDYKDINNKLASSQQTLIRGATPKRSHMLDKLIITELQNLSIKNTTTSIKVNQSTF